MTRTERTHFWQQRITDWQTTGLSGSVYCKQQSLIYHQFVYWRSKLSAIESHSNQEEATTVFVRVASVRLVHQIIRQLFPHVSCPN